VLPRITTTIAATDIVDAIAAINIGIAIEVIVHVHVDVAAAPTATPTPAAAPGRAYCQPDTKRNRAGRNHGSR
jgi:hypothetical protein